MRIYTPTTKGTTRTDSDEPLEQIELRVPDNVTASDLDRAIEKMRREVRAQERS